MWPYHPDLLATPVPRYTSFPTAAEFGDLPPDAYQTALEQVEGDVSLYVHIPFCEKICFYCGCNTAAAGRKQRLQSYLAALHREIDRLAAVLPASARIRRIAFGGGSPNAIDPADFLELFDTLVGVFSLTDPGISIELDPRTMTREWASALAAARITRASLGVQTFSAQSQERIGRLQPEGMVVQTVDWLRAAGVTSLNFDLMYGLPGQSRDDLLDSLQRSRVLGADRLAVFGYAHVPHIVPRQRAIDDRDMPEACERFAMASLAFEYLCTHGYIPAGFDHFAKPGDPMAHAALFGTLRRNFQGFTDDRAETLIGLGSSAISCFPNLLVQNEKNSGRYRMMMSQGMLAGTRGITRSHEDQLRSAIIEALLCQGEARLTPGLMSEVASKLCPFTTRGLAEIIGQRLVITADGLPYSRTIAALFDPYRNKSATRFSSAV